MTFFIAVFILVMQIIWLYIDDMLGKGIKWYVIVEFFFYTSANVVPLAMPLSILLASLMTFGNLGEHFELVSFKAAGVSLQRVMKPLIIFVLLLSIGAFYFANNIIPVANLKFYALLHDIRSQKPAVNIKSGVFYNEIEGYTIRVKEKVSLDDGRDMLKDVMIYNHSENNGNRQVTIADSGYFSLSPDKTGISIKLFKGIDYSDPKEERTKKVHPFSRYAFDESEVFIDLSGFNFNRTDEDAFKHDYRLFNIKQLKNAVDTINSNSKESQASFSKIIKDSYLFNDSAHIKQSQKSQLKTNAISSFDYKTLKKGELDQLFGIATNNARTSKGRSGAAEIDITRKKERLARIKVEWHRKFTFSIACLIMFFIGAPLGAIVKKGGLGMPVVISIVFFLLFWILSITGEKMANEMVIEAYQGMWLSSLILFPLGIFFTYKATTDSDIFNMDAYLSFFKKIFRRKSN
jgi:lipopolysaccharide export system permease protein